MVEVNSFDEVRANITHIRSLRNGFITNFFPEQRKVDIWARHRIFFMEESDEVILFIKQDDGFNHVFYCATNKHVLNEALSSLPADEAYVLDQIVDKRTDASLLDSFIDNGFAVRKCLVRMSKINSVLADIEASKVYDASEEDLCKIDKMLHTFFDKYSEQLPTSEELNDFLELNHIILCKKDKEIAGFILYDMAPSTLHLRYWLVNPRFRNQGVGSLLFKEYQKRGASCKRHLLWVAKDNFDAIKRYEHYGYKNEDMTDYVMCKNIRQACIGE